MVFQDFSNRLPKFLLARQFFRIFYENLTDFVFSCQRSKNLGSLASLANFVKSFRKMLAFSSIYQRGCKNFYSFARQFIRISY
jgi:hypothetical protein